MPGQRHEFCDLFHRSYARENQSPTSNQLGVFRFCCPYLSGLHTSLFWMSYRVACLELLDAPCPNGSFWHKKKVYLETHIRLSLCISTQIQHLVWCDPVLPSHELGSWKKSCSQAALSYGDRVVFGKTIQGISAQRLVQAYICGCSQTGL